MCPSNHFYDWQLPWEYPRLESCIMMRWIGMHRTNFQMLCRRYWIHFFRPLVLLAPWLSQKLPPTGCQDLGSVPSRSSLQFPRSQNLDTLSGFFLSTEPGQSSRLFCALQDRETVFSFLLHYLDMLATSLYFGSSFFVILALVLSKILRVSWVFLFVAYRSLGRHSCILILAFSHVR